MTEHASYTQIRYYVSIGVSLMNKDFCGICVDNTPPTNYIFRPPNDTAYIIYKIYSFDAGRKAPYGEIIRKLKSDTFNILPYSGFNPPVNPDNKFYTKLPISKFSIIDAVIARIAGGLSFDKDMKPSFEIEETSDEKIEEARAVLESEIISPNRSCAIILSTDGKTKPIIHKFPRAQTAANNLLGVDSAKTRKIDSL